ncbi:MAG: putative hydrolase YxeP [Spirochaetes bacterium ADurb.Bin110]|nr:MAG: putative hydrolase YxeP [Spirochaetes bacterium ADurb.Bin110]
MAPWNNPSFLKEVLFESKAMEEWLIEMRRSLHRIPEPGNKEQKTSNLICKMLEEMNIPYRSYGTAIVGLVEGKEPGPCAALRADMDALPIEEPSDRSYASLHHGYMHACGHDAHMTVALGVAKLLAAHRQDFSGSVKFLFQPAEETTGGAKPMIEAGCLENPHVDLVLGLHVVPELPAGMVEVKIGPFYGASDSLEIVVKGRSSHAAYPEQGVDAIVVSASIIQALQTIVSRSISALDNAVLTIGKIQGGVRSNILANEVIMIGTIRTLSEDLRCFMRTKVKEICTEIAAAFGASCEVHIRPSYPVLINDESATELVRATAISILGESKVIMRQEPNLGVEDFAYFLRERPGTFWHLGCGKPRMEKIYPLHSAEFDIDEACLPIGVAIQAASALTFLQLDNQEQGEEVSN